jgi:hypothetical protein
MRHGAAGAVFVQLGRPSTRSASTGLAGNGKGRLIATCKQVDRIHTRTRGSWQGRRCFRLFNSWAGRVVPIRVGIQARWKARVICAGRCRSIHKAYARKPNFSSKPRSEAHIYPREQKQSKIIIIPSIHLSSHAFKQIIQPRIPEIHVDQGDSSYLLAAARFWIDASVVAKKSSPPRTS